MKSVYRSNDMSMRMSSGKSSSSGATFSKSSGSKNANTVKMGKGGGVMKVSEDCGSSNSMRGK